MANAVGPNGYDGGGGGGGRPPRLPRWTRQEILVLIQGKKVVEGRGRGGGSGRTEVGAEGGGRQQLEPKWAAVAGYCRRHGVDRGPVQCRKRWSNLAGDYKKIKEWERASGGGDKGGGEPSFWAMRNDLRRERRLPGFFDREVYDILDGVAAAAAAAGEEEREEEVEEEAAEKRRRRRRKKKEEEVEEEEEAVFDSGRTAAEDGLFSDSEDEDAVAVAVAVPVAVTAEAARGGGEEERSAALLPTAATVASAAAAAGPVVVMPISGKCFLHICYLRNFPI